MKIQKIKGSRLDNQTKVSDLVEDMKGYGFQASELHKAVEIIKKMRREKATIILSFTSNMVSSGLREIFADLCRRNFVDVIITTAGSIEEDIIKTKKPFLLGDFNLNDKELNKRGINRIGNLLVPNTRYGFLEDFLLKFFEKAYTTQNKNKKLLSPSDITYCLGKSLKDNNSFLYWASKNKIPVFCPAITDGAFGLQVYFFKENHKDFGIDISGDMKQLANIILSSNKVGAIILGGGMPKHYAIGVNILRDGLDYAVYISTGSEYDGSLSGARPKEAISWNKINKMANYVFVEGEATIIFPLVVCSIT